MKDAAAAAIVEKLPVHEGAAIMFGLPAKKVLTNHGKDESSNCLRNYTTAEKRSPFCREQPNKRVTKPASIFL